MVEPYADEQFVDLVRVKIIDRVIKTGKGGPPTFGECAPGVVATPTSFFYDPKRWRYSSGSSRSGEPIVEVQCQGVYDVEQVAIAAVQNLVALKGDKWIIEVEGIRTKRGKKK